MGVVSRIFSPVVTQKGVVALARYISINNRGGIGVVEYLRHRGGIIKGIAKVLLDDKELMAGFRFTTINISKLATRISRMEKEEGSASDSGFSYRYPDRVTCFYGEYELKEVTGFSIGGKCYNFLRPVEISAKRIGDAPSRPLR